MLLRSTLVINGISTVLCGAALLAAPGGLAELLGGSAPALLAVVGGGLVLYAGGLFWAAPARAHCRRRPIPDVAAWTAIVLDLGWVFGSIAVIEVGILTRIGTGLVALVAAVVLTFAVLQFVGVRKTPRPAGPGGARR